MMQEADAVLSIYQPACTDIKGINKLWWRHMDYFSAEAWHANLARQLQLLLKVTPPPIAKSETSPAGKRRIFKIIRIGYIDRQNAGRCLPRAFHKEIVARLQQLQKHSPYSDVVIEFHHLHMETLAPVEQIRIAASLDVLIGAHGNGLSHMFFMKPGGAVLEIFWEFSFQFDYATAAHMMRHEYLCIYNGRPIDLDRIAARDPSLRRDYSWSSSHTNDTTPVKDQIQSGIEASLNFIHVVIARLRNSARSATGQ